MNELDCLRAMVIRRANVAPSTADLNDTSAANAAATVTLAAATGVRNVVDGVFWSYSGSESLPSEAAPGSITISDGVTAVAFIKITAPGAGFFPVKRKGTAGAAMTVVLAAGGADVIGTVGVSDAWTE